MIGIHLRYLFLEPLQVDALARRLIDRVESQNLLRLLDFEQPAPLQRKKVYPRDHCRPNADSRPAQKLDAQNGTRGSIAPKDAVFRQEKD